MNKRDNQASHPFRGLLLKIPLHFLYLLSFIRLDHSEWSNTLHFYFHLACLEKKKNRGYICLLKASPSPKLHLCMCFHFRSFLNCIFDYKAIGDFWFFVYWKIFWEKLSELGTPTQHLREHRQGENHLNLVCNPWSERCIFPREVYQRWSRTKDGFIPCLLNSIQEVAHLRGQAVYQRGRWGWQGGVLIIGQR